MKHATIILGFFLITFYGFGKDYELLSPNKQVKLTISVNKLIEINISTAGNLMLGNSPVNLMVDGKDFLQGLKVLRTKYSTNNSMLRPVVQIKSAIITDHYNELTIHFNGGYAINCRAYNDGVAYRWITDLKKDIRVNNEQLDLNLPDSAYGYLMKVPDFSSMAEEPFIPSYVMNYGDSSLFTSPTLFKNKEGNFLLVTESDLVDYPGMWFKKENGKLRATWPGKVKKVKEGNCLGNFTVLERENYLAYTAGSRHFPWRVFAVGNTEKQLVTNQMVYLLAPPAEGDFSWVKPGLAMLDWWGKRNIFGTCFKGGINTPTQQYFIDFNNKYGIRYFILDEGWSDHCDLKKINPNINLDTLKNYAEKKDVGLVYWVHTFALAQDVAGYMDFLKSKGAAGLKVDFFLRDDQDAVNLRHTIAREAAKRQLVLDFHGTCKPFGLNRTYPNLLTTEGLIEFEMNGVTNWANPVHHNLLPYIRMVAGPLDYIPGTLNNAQQKEFAQMQDRPMGLGSRAHAMALAVIFESPMTMWPDAPSDYLDNDRTTTFLSKIPVTWDETRVIDAKIGEYTTIARRKGNTWYVGAITNWSSRDFELPLNFLESGEYQLSAVADGVNTNTRATDHRFITENVNSNSNLKISLANGGGWVGIFTKK